MRLVTYNVQYAEGMNRRWKYLEVYKYFGLIKKNLKKITDYLKVIDPDILGLVEIDSGSIRFGKKSSSEFIAQTIGMDYWVEKTKYAQRSLYKVLNYVPIIRKQSNAILSKYQIESNKFYYLSKGVKRLVIQTTIKVPVGFEIVNLNLFIVHLSLRKKTRAKQISELAEILSACASPKIVFGDFNSFKGLKELQPLIQSGLRNPCSQDDKTFPSWKPKRLLDHILVSDEIIVKKFKVLDGDFSDHLPIMIDFHIDEHSKN